MSIFHGAAAAEKQEELQRSIPGAGFNRGVRDAGRNFHHGVAVFEYEYGHSPTVLGKCLQCRAIGDGYGWNHSVLTTLLDETMSFYRIDPSRAHLTGFSMGGYST